MRLIDADDLIEWWQEFADKGYSTPMACIVQNLKDAPTIDAVKVVRCRECKQGDMELCHSIWSWFGDDGFCIFGKRRTE